MTVEYAALEAHINEKQRKVSKQIFRDLWIFKRLRKSREVKTEQWTEKEKIARMIVSLRENELLRLWLNSVNVQGGRRQRFKNHSEHIVEFTLKNYFLPFGYLKWAIRGWKKIVNIYVWCWFNRLSLSGWTGVGKDAKEQSLINFIWFMAACCCGKFSLRKISVRLGAIY